MPIAVSSKMALAAAVLPMAVAEGDGHTENSAAVWLLSVANPDKKALALQTRSVIRNATGYAVGRCAAIVKDTTTGIYERGLAVLALGRTLEREFADERQRNTQYLDCLRKACGGTGGILDSLLDIIGQCTLSKTGKALALSAGCGVADAHNIRTNCCALISLLVALLATTIGNDADAIQGPRHEKSGASLNGKCNSKDLHADLDEGKRLGAGAADIGGEALGVFVSMKATPSPDIITSVQKKGWAARLQQQASPSTASSARASTTRWKSLPKAHHLPVDVCARTEAFRSERKAVDASEAASCGPFRRAAMTRLSAEHTPAGARDEHHSRVPTPNISTSNRITSPKGSRSPWSSGRDLDYRRAKGGRTSDVQYAALDVGTNQGSREDHPQSVVGPGKYSKHAKPASELLASPPRLLRVEANGRASSTLMQDTLSPRQQGLTVSSAFPSGRSGAQRTAKRRRTANVWHTVAIAAEKKPSARSNTANSRGTITLSPVGMLERFGSPPPVRPSVLFGADPASEVEMNDNGDRTDVIAADNRLGYQVPRLWFPQAHPRQPGVHEDQLELASKGVSMPPPRLRPSDSADRPVGSDTVVQEYQQMQAFQVYSSVTRTRPPSTDPLHAVDASVQLVKTLGRRPEKEDPAIARGWSPRGGRKLLHHARQRVRGSSSPTDKTRNGTVNIGRTRPRPPTSQICSSSHVGAHHDGESTGAGSAHEIADQRDSIQNGCSVKFPAALSGTASSQRWQHRSRRHLPSNIASSVKLRRDRCSRAPEWEHCAGRCKPDLDDQRDSRVGKRDDDGGACYFVSDGESCLVMDASGDAKDCKSCASTSSAFCPPVMPSSPTRKVGNSGNLGGWYASPASPYRTYRAKHAKIVRAHSSERAVVLARRSRTARQQEESLCLQPRSRSVDSAGRDRRGRWGTSGMLSPLLRGTGLGLLESNVTGKVSLGVQLPRDQSSACGRARAAAHATEGHSIFSPGLVVEPTMFAKGAGHRLRYTTRSRRGGLREHQSSLLSGEEGEDERSDEEHTVTDAYRRNERTDDVADGVTKVGEVKKATANQATADAIKQQFRDANMRWPGTLPAKRKRAPRKRSARAGREGGRENLVQSAVDHSCSRVHTRGSFSTSSVGSRSAYEGEGLSSSSPRTRMGTSCDYRSMAGSSAGDDPMRGGGRRCHINRVQRNMFAGSPTDTSDSEGFYRSSSRSPLIRPLDPYRASRMVTRAGTLVSRRDVEAVECAARLALQANRRASRARRRTAGSCSPENVRQRLRYREGRRRQRWHQIHSRDHDTERGTWTATNADDHCVSNENRDDDAEFDRELLKILLPSTRSICAEVVAIRKADSAMREEQRAQVQLNVNALPLALLLVHPGGAAYVRGFVARALQLWQRERARARMTHALARWKIECEAQRFFERGLGYRTRFGALKIKQLVLKRRPIVLRARLATWRAFCRMEIYTARAAAVVLVQTQYRRWKAFRLFLSMHYSKPLGGALSDIYLEEEREGVRFKIDPNVRKDRRCFWLAAIGIQTRWRMLPKRAYYRLLKIEVKRVQTHFRMWSDRRVFLFFKEKTIVAQSFARLAMWRPKWCRFRLIPPVIQRFVRGHLARQKVRQMRTTYHKAIESIMGKAIPFQTAWRGFAARRTLRHLHEEKDEEWHAAVLLQRAWYRRMGQFSAFVLVCCLRIMDKTEEDQARAARKFDMTLRARLIQRTYKRRYRSRTRHAAVLLQSWWRNKTGRDFVVRLRVQKWASRKLRCWLIACMRRRHSASRLIAVSWLITRPGRLLIHLQGCQDHDEKRWWIAWRESRDLSAAKLQAVVRGKRVRRLVYIEAVRRIIQRVGFRYMCRRRARKRLAERKRYTACSYISTLVNQGVKRELSRRASLRITARGTLQSWGRGVATREILKRAEELVRVEVLMATRLQRTWRNRRSMQTAMRQAANERRGAACSFDSVGPRVEDVATACVAQASAHFNPRNGPAGCGLWRFCRRLGCDGDVFPLLKSAGVSGAEGLRGLCDGDLMELGIVSTSIARKRQRDGKGDGIFQAEKLREMLIKLVCGAASAKPPSRENRQIFSEFQPIEGNSQRRNIVRDLFLDFFGAALTQRAESFSAALSEGGAGERAEVTIHQLRRYFGLCGSPSMAKSRVQELINPPHDEERRASVDDSRRVQASVHILSTGADKIRQLYRVPLVEKMNQGGPATALIEALRVLPERAIGEEQRQRGRRAACGNTFMVATEHKRTMSAIATSLYDLLYYLTELGPAARATQRTYRAHLGRGFLALSKHQSALSRHYKRYLWERGTNHVKDEWEGARKAEAKENQRLYQEWLRHEEIRVVEEELYRWGVMRYGWREEDLEGVPGVKVYRLYKHIRSKHDQGKVGPKGPDRVEMLQEESDEYPLYHYEDQIAAQRIGRAGRTYIARRVVYILRRDKMRADKERTERLEWEEAERQADNHVTVHLSLVTVSAKRYFFAVADDVQVDPDVEGEYDPPTDDHLEFWVGFLLDARTPARPFTGFTPNSSHGSKSTSHKTSTPAGSETGSRAGRGAWQRWNSPAKGWMRGEVFLVNPTEVVSAEGVQTFPKGTFGIRYLDTGEEIPDVPRECLRAITLSPGMKVEARYGGERDFYPGVIRSVNERNGRALSYCVEYDDGDVEKIVKRGNIAPFPREVVALDETASEALRRASVRRDGAKLLQSRRDSIAVAWRERMRKAEDDYLTAAAVTTAAANSKKVTSSGLFVKVNRGVTGSGDEGRNINSVAPAADVARRGRADDRGVPQLSEKGHVSDSVGDIDAVACIGMIEAALKLGEETRPRLAVKLKIGYTRQATRFRCSEVRTKSGVAVWKDYITGACTRGRPRYSFEEAGAARKVQAAWAGLQGRRAFRAQLAEQSVRSLSIACINEASSHAWIGHGEEGLTIEMWLSRAGVLPTDARRVAAGALKTLAQSSSIRGSGGRVSASIAGNTGGRRGQLPFLSCSTFRTWLGGGSKSATSGERAGTRGRGPEGAHKGEAIAAGAGTVSGGDAKLRKLGLESSIDRRRVMAVMLGEEETPSLINWFEGPTDRKTIEAAIAAGEPQALKIIWKEFPGNQSRAESMAKRVAASTFPVTRLQLSAWLKRHEGRPGVAQSSMSEQLLDVPVTASREAEAKAYEVYRLFCQRLSILASNMRLKGLWNTIARASAKADDILAEEYVDSAHLDGNYGAASSTTTPLTETCPKKVHCGRKGKTVATGGGRRKGIEPTTSTTCKVPPSNAASPAAGVKKTARAPGGVRKLPAEGRAQVTEVVASRRHKKRAGDSEKSEMADVEDKATSKTSTWGHARAALVLRVEAVSVALKWVAGAKAIQVNFRAFRCRSSYRALLSRRRHAATILQSVERRRIAYLSAADMRMQRASPWEQLWDDESCRLYYFDKETEESYWDYPPVPFRPMVRDRLSGALIQAWPQLERDLLEASDVEPGFCMKCRTEKATRVCDQCVLPPRGKHSWGAGKWHLCFVCFAERHSDTPEISSHTFSPAQSALNITLICSTCQEPASRRCTGLEVSHRALVVAARMLQHARQLEELTKRQEWPLASTFSLSASTGSGDKGAHGGARASRAIADSMRPGENSKQEVATVTKDTSLSTIGSSSIAADSCGDLTSNKDEHGIPEATNRGSEQHSDGCGNSGPPVTREEFGRIVGNCDLPYSLAWIDAMYGMCVGERGRAEHDKVDGCDAATTVLALAGTAVKSRGDGDGGSAGGGRKGKKRGKKYTMTRVQFWSVFGAALAGTVDDCDDLSCSACWEHVHRRGLRAKHSWKGFKPGAPVCIACCRDVAERKCKVCDDLLCTTCFKESHARGKKQRHGWAEFFEEPLGRPRCHECHRRVGDRSCPTCKMDLCDSCEAFVHEKVCNGAKRSETEIRVAGRETATTSRKKQLKSFASSSGAAGTGGHITPPELARSKRRREIEVFSGLAVAGTELVGDESTLRALDVLLGIAENMDDIGETEGTEEEQEEDMPLICDMCGKTPDVECEQCRTVYCSNTWAGNPGCFNRDHERGNRRTHTKRPYAHARDMALRAKRLEKERQEQRERDRRAEGDKCGRQRVEAKRLLSEAQQREMGRELKLQKEARSELKRRLRRRRAHAVGLKRSLLPTISLKAAKRAERRLGFFLHLPSRFRIPPAVALTKQRVVDILRGRGGRNSLLVSSRDVGGEGRNKGDCVPSESKARTLNESPSPPIRKAEGQSGGKGRGPSSRAHGEVGTLRTSSPSGGGCGDVRRVLSHQKGLMSPRGPMGASRKAIVVHASTPASDTSAFGKAGEGGRG